MITGELKNRIDSLWEIFWTGGLTNPLDVIEQMTYLMFIRDLDDTDNIRAKEAAMLGLPYKSIFSGEIQIGERIVDGNQLKWSVFHDFPAGKMYTNVQELVFPFIKELHGDKNSAYAKYMGDAIFKVPTPLMLDKVVTAMDEIYEQMSRLKEADTRGDVYEYLLSKLATAGVNGQFRTPRHIIRMIVDMMKPRPDDMICDPACGTSGFLVAASEYLKENRKEEVLFDRKNKEHYMNHMFYGFDMDRTMLRIGAMNMMTHGVENPFIEYRDSLSDQNQDKEKYSLILANPPFKGSLDYDIVSADLLKVCKTKKTELLFLALFLRMLKVGGRCACIVPDGVLFGSSTAHKAIRKELIENNRLEAVISMPSGVFKPYAGVSTAVLVFTKTGHGKLDANASSEDGQYPFFTCSKEPLKISSYSYDCECVLVAGNGDLNVKYYNGKFDAYQRTYIIEDNDSGKLFMPYLYYFMEGYMEELRKQAIGGVIKYIKLENLTDALIKLPSIDEQKAIVNVLEKVKNVLTTHDKEICKLDELMRARFVEMFGDTVTNPLGWEEHRLDEYIDFLTSGSRGWAQYFVDEENELFITIKNVKNNHITLDNIQYVDAPNNKEAERTKVKAGDLLISITADLGRTGVVDSNIAEKGAYINQHLSLVRLDKGRINPFYVSFFLETEGGKRQFDSKNQNGVKAGLNFEAIKSLKILVPPLEMQETYLEFVKATDKLKVAIQKSLEKTQLLFDSL